MDRVVAMNAYPRYGVRRLYLITATARTNNTQNELFPRIVITNLDSSRLRSLNAKVLLDTNKAKKCGIYVPELCFKQGNL